jgi:dienelactone hydrolase
MQTEPVTYMADGLAMESQLYYESGSGRRPGVLVFPEAPGLGKHALSRAKRLAGLGYVALACDLHGSRQVFSDMKQMMAVMGTFRNDLPRIRARAQGGLDALKTRPEVDPNRIAAIGYCFGGTMALELARGGAELAGVVGFHSVLSTPAPQAAKNIKGKVLVCIGTEDPLIPVEQRNAFEEEMRAGNVNWQMTLFGAAGHGFTNPDVDKLGRPGFSYNAQADARSWQQMCAFFEEVFALR